MKISLDHLIKLGFALALVILAGIGVVSYRSIASFVETSRAVERSHAVIEKLDNLTMEITDVESASRGFIVAGKDFYLDPYYAAAQQVGQTIADLRRLTADDARQQRFLAEIEPRVAEKLAWHRRSIEIRREKGLEQGAALVGAGRGHELMDQIRSVTGAMSEEEKDLLKQRSAEARSRAGRSIQVTLVGSLLGFSMLLFVYIHLNREVGRRRRSEEKLIHSNRLYAVLSHVSEAVVRIRDRGELFREVCRIAVEDGAFRMSWVGLVDPSGRVVPATHYGGEEGSLQQDRVSVAGAPDEPSSVETVLGEGRRHFVVNDIVADQRLPWRVPALGRGYRSAAAFPLQVGTRLVGVFKVYGAEPGLFDDENVALLDEVAANVSLALERMEQEARRRQAEVALRLQAEIIEQVHDSVISTDLDGNVTTWNKGAERLTGYAKEESIGRHISFLYPEEEREFLRAGVIEPLVQKGVHETEVRMRRKSGEDICARLSLSLLRDDRGVATGMIGYSMDVTEARRTQQALRESEARFRQMAENIEEMFWIADSNLSEMLYVSPAYEKMWGRTCQSLYEDPRSLLLAIHPEDRERVRADLDRALEDGNWDREYRIVRPDGSVRWVWDRAFPIRDESGTVLRFAGITQDITVRKEAEQELRTRAAQQKAVAQLSQYALEGEDLDTLLDATVKVTARVLEVDLCKVLELLPDGSGLRMRAGVGWKEGCVGHAVVGAGADSQAGYTLLSSTPVVVEDLRTESRFTGPQLLHDHAVISGVSVVIGDPQRPLGVLGAHSTRRRTFTEDDLHFLLATASTLAASIERRRAEQDLRFSEARFRSIFEQAGTGIATVSADGGFLQVNQALCSFLGYGEAELLGLRTFDITHGEDLERTLFEFDEVKTGRQRLVDVEKRLLRKDGTMVWAHVSGAWLFDQDAAPIHAIVLVQDITTRKSAEEEIRRLNQDLERRVAERTMELAALNTELAERNREVERANRLKSEFLARMSHELRTPMNAIIGFSDLLAEEPEGPLGELYKGYIAHIREGAGHLLELINDVLDLSKIEAGRIDLYHEDLSASEALSEVMSVIRPLAEAKKLQVVGDLPAPLRVYADRTRFKQILYNLLSNAVKFTHEGGRVWVEASRRGDRVWISVSDTGVGIPAEEHAAIFEEFHQVGVTTTGVKEGTGLGLAITKRLVELQGGGILVESEPGQGSRFTFVLPAVGHRARGSGATTV